MSYARRVPAADYRDDAVLVKALADRDAEAFGFLLDRYNAGPHLLNLPGGYPVIFGVFVVWLLLGTLLILKVPERR